MLPKCNVSCCFLASPLTAWRGRSGGRSRPGTSVPVMLDLRPIVALRSAKGRFVQEQCAN